MNNNLEKQSVAKSNINWLITIYPRIEEKLGRIRNCEI